MSKIEQSTAERFGRLAEWSQIQGALPPVFGYIPKPPAELHPKNEEAVKPKNPESAKERSPVDTIILGNCIEERKPGSTILQRIGFHWRSGVYWSYPYGLISLIECPAPDFLRLCCHSNDIEAIEIRGVGLDKIIPAISEQRIVSLRECDNTNFPNGETVILEITIKKPEKKNPRLE